MQRRFAFGCAALAVVTIVLVLSFPSAAQAQLANTARPLITEKVSDSNTVTLAGNTRPEAIAANDRGPLAPDAPMEHMLLQLKRSPEQEQALSKFIDELHTPGTPNYHNWISAQEFGQRFGLAPQDLAAITGWLELHGFTINVVYPNGMMIDFSGNAGQVREAFGTEIHNLEVNGVKHFANFSDPKIPAALAPAVVGIVSLHDFSPHTMHKMRPEYTFTSGTNTLQAVVPADLATIYNLNPLFNNGISGQGQTVVVIEDTNVLTPADWTTFRSTFGLSSFTSGSFTQVHPAPPTGTNNCGNPGANGDDGEAILDAEYASAAAPSATIELASCTDTSSFGGLIALQNLLNETATPPAIVSISYGECEAVNGSASNAAFSAVYQQAVTEGVSIFVSSGDEGAASCDANETNATHGIGVSGFASTPFNVAVGGTDFGDTFAGTNSTYWNTTNTATFGSARSYIPEIPWDDSCAGALVSSFTGFPAPYGTTGFCNSTEGMNFTTTGAGSGGPSGCASGMPATPGVVGGTCAGWAKPSWQTLVGVPSDGVRDLPDVSLFSSNGFWGHFFVFCYSGPASNGGAPCTGAPSGWSGAGGTSFASPILAGIQALVNQKTGSRQGNPNPTYYSLAATEYGASGDASCNSTLGNGVASTCVFYDVKQGDMAVNCTGTHNCFLPSGTFGVLSTSNTAYKPAYGTATGWDFATGIGTVNVANLVNAWPGSSTPNFTLSSAPSSVTITQGGAGGTSTISVAPTNGFSGSVTFSATGLPSGVTAAFSPNPSTSSSTLTLTASGSATTGTATVTITGTSGSLTHTTTVSLTVNAAVIPNFTLAASPTSVTIVQGGTGGTSTITITPQNGFTGSVTMSASGLPTGVTAGFSPNPATTSSTLTLTASGTATTGSATVTITGTSGSLTHTTTVSLTVNAAPNFSLAASPASVTIVQAGAGGTSTVTITRLNGFTSSVAMSASGLPSGVTAAFSPNPATTTSTLTLIAGATATTGAATVTITGTSGSLTHTTTVSLTVNPSPNFSLAASPTSVTISQGAAGTSTVTITRLNGFTSSVTMSASGLPSGVTAAFSPNPATTTSKLTLTASATAAAGPATVTITGTSGSLTHTTTVSLTVDAAPNFALSDSPSSLTVSRGGSATSAITIAPQNGFTGSVSLAASGLPTGVTATFSPNPATASSTLTLRASTFAVASTKTVTITGTSGTLTHSTSLSVTVTTTATANFSLGASPASVTVTKGGAGGTSTVTVTRLNGFTSNVTFSASGLPTGVTAAFSPNPATTTSTLTLTASSTAATGTSTVTITGTAGTLTHTATVSLTVNATASPDFSLSASPGSVTVTKGGAGGTSTVTVTRLNGFTSNVTLSASGLPTGVTAVFSPNPATTTSTLTLTASGTAATGTSTVTITGTSGSLTHTATLSLTVNATTSPDFSLSASPASVSVARGSHGATTITITPSGGFTGAVTLSATGMGAGTTAAFGTNPATGTSTLTFTAATTATVGSVSVTITGTSGSLTQTTKVTVRVGGAGA